MELSSGTILLVEDTEDDVFLMRRALKAAGILNPLQVVEDGQQAIDYLSGKGAYEDRSMWPFPRLLFLDLKLPVKSGFEVLEWLRSNPCKVKPVVFVMSSSNLPKDKERAISLGAVSYIVKPPTGEFLLQLAQDYQFEWWTKASVT
jgi:CheY-like chemotaxis protein